MMRVIDYISDHGVFGIFRWMWDELWYYMISERIGGFIYWNKRLVLQAKRIRAFLSDVESPYSIDDLIEGRKQYQLNELLGACGRDDEIRAPYVNIHQAALRASIEKFYGVDYSQKKIGLGSQFQINDQETWVVEGYNPWNYNYQLRLHTFSIRVAPTLILGDEYKGGR